MLPKVKIEEIYRRQAKTVFRVAVSYGLEREECKDIVQDCFIRLMQSGFIPSSEDHEKAWLIVTAGNLCKDYWRQKARQNVPLEEADGAVAPDKANVDFMHLRELLRKLPERLRLPLHFYYYEGYNSREIADMLNLHPVTVRKQLQEAREKLREHMGGEWE